jgi:hypothetical protein
MNPLFQAPPVERRALDQHAADPLAVATADALPRVRG